MSEEIYAAYSVKQDVRAGDIFLVRDGTYLIGQACLLTNHDLPCLYQSHILKFRLNEASPISLYLFLACLNSPIVKQQIRANQFTADIIDTVGNRYLDLVLPVPQKKSLRDRISNEVRLNVTRRIDLRERIRKFHCGLKGNSKVLILQFPMTGYGAVNYLEIVALHVQYRIFEAVFLFRNTMILSLTTP